MKIDEFYIAGINYKKTDVSLRGQFAINQQQHEAILQKAAKFSIQEVFVLSTCNRTEIYGVASSAYDLIQLLNSETVGDAAAISQMFYIKQGWQAVQHIFNVGAGLDSQIIGDYEIIGQIKKAAQFAKQCGTVGAFLERLVNSVIQSSKEIKSNTALSGGTISVSFAAVQYLKQHVADIFNRQIVLLGTGKIGRNTCKNLVDYLSNKNITLINRTDESAKILADEFGLKHELFSNMSTAVQKADVVIVATQADAPVVTLKHIKNFGNKVLIDLSVPVNIEPSVKDLPGITLLNVDDLSVINDAALQKRLAEIPKANNIIYDYINEFNEWLGMRANVPALKAVRQKLQDMYTCRLFHSVYPEKTTDVQQPNTDVIQKTLNKMAVKMREQQRLAGCCYIEAINDFIHASEYN